MTGGVRDAALAIWDVVQLGRKLFHSRDERPHRWSWTTVCSWIAYGAQYPSTKRRIPVEVDALVKKWMPIIRGLAIAHSKDELDRCEFEAEAHLSPLLTAPVRQLREFYQKLCDALRADPKTPLFVSAAFDAWHEVILKKAPDQDVVQLKTQLASEIADLVEKEIQPDLREALIGALKWRSPEALEQIRGAVQAGAKPRLKGRESCLFLVAGDACVML